MIESLAAREIEVMIAYIKSSEFLVDIVRYLLFVAITVSGGVCGEGLGSLLLLPIVFV